MPRIDFNTVEEAEDFSPLPEGKYLCRLQTVEKAQTQYGDEMWKLRFAVAEGPHERRYVFDNLVFSEAALKRVKLICSRLGVDVSGEVDLTPDLLIHRTCWITVDTEEYEDEDDRPKKRNVVPFAGYESVQAADEVAGPDDPADTGTTDEVDLSEDELLF